MEAFNERSTMPTATYAHGHHSRSGVFLAHPPPQQQEPPPDHLVASTGYPPTTRPHSRNNTPFDTYTGSGPPVTMNNPSSTTPHPLGSRSSSSSGAFPRRRGSSTVPTCRRRRHRHIDQPRRCPAVAPISSNSIRTRTLRGRR
ncbi:hypothetical protein PG996_012293 [Apiospora saccharicola]|uniref:Uncharacterized protein n=1 Tax=Apiospora saccharicola TaxID=335842 RepID=A0ABR1U254_9PEZI